MREPSYSISVVEYIGHPRRSQYDSKTRNASHYSRDDGNGLKNMKLRAARLAGELQVRSAEGQGTTVLLRAPLPA